MGKNDKNIKQIYDYTFPMISNLHMKKNTISQDEMYFLLSVLDLVMRDNEAEFLDLLREWQSGQQDEEIDAIIKATLLQLDFNDAISLQQNQAIIADLLAYKLHDKIN